MGEGLRYDSALLGDVLQWDVATWKKALFCWDEVLLTQEHRQARAIDLGARDGGLSLWLALKGYDVVCSDFGGPSSLAAPLHERYGVSGHVEYRDINATDIDFPNSSFDVVVFKSILGGIGTYHNVAAIEQAMGEVLRILKPGGVLLFAENLLGSKFHRFARSHFVRWGKRWHYMPLGDMEELLSRFESYQIRSYGYFSCVKKDFAPFVLVDKLICKRELSHNHYMGYGHALKAN